MQLRHIKKTNCPHCGAHAVGERITGQHTNGQQFESREFKCGLIIEFVPNYGEERERSECPKSEAATGRVAKRRKLAEQIAGLITASDADVKYRQYLLDEAYRLADWRDAPKIATNPNE